MTEPITPPEKSPLEAKLAEARAEAAQERRARQALETRVSEMETAMGTMRTELETANTDLGRFKARDKRTAAVAKAREAFTANPENKGKAVNWDKVNTYLERVGTDPAKLDADLGEAIGMFAETAPPPPNGALPAFPPPNGAGAPPAGGGRQLTGLDAAIIGAFGLTPKA